MMLRRSLLLATGLYLAVLASGSGPVRATTVDSAVQLIETLGRDALSTLQQTDKDLNQREAAFGAILRDGFDLHLIARFVLGKYWRQASPEQQSEYFEAFSVFVIKTYARRLGGFQGQSFTVINSIVTGDKNDVVVTTRIDRPSGPPIAAAWRVREIDGKHRIIDVLVEGVSMAVTQRQEFTSVVQNNGIDGLVQILRAQTERLSASAG